MYNSIALIVGHLIGDYVLQNDWMAVNKPQRGWKGRGACMLHCVIYSFCIALCVCLDGWKAVADWPTFWTAVGIAFVTHYPIDRWGLTGQWMAFFGQTMPDAGVPEGGVVHLHAGYLGSYGNPGDPPGILGASMFAGADFTLPDYPVARITVTAVPAPGAMALLGLAGIVGIRRRRAD